MLSIRSGQSMETEEGIARYVNRLKYSIQDETSVIFYSIREVYQQVLRAEEKQRSRGGGTRGKGMNMLGRGQRHGKESEGIHP